MSKLTKCTSFVFSCSQGVPAGQGEHVQEADDELPHSAEHNPQVQILLQVPHGQQQGGGQGDKRAGWLK